MGAWHVTDTCYQGYVAPPIMNIIIGQALPDPGLNNAEYALNLARPWQIGLLPSKTSIFKTTALCG